MGGLELERDQMKADYIEAIQRIERLHRQCLDVVKDELDQMGTRDLNPVQAMLLFNMGDDEVTVGELTQRGCYQGSNVSYNVKKLTELGYLISRRAEYDKRASFVRVSDKGRAVREYLDRVFGVHAEELAKIDVDAQSLSAVLARLERFFAMARNGMATSRLVRA